MDQSIFFLINGQWAHPALDLPMAVLSSWAVWAPIALIIAVLLAIFGGFRGRAALVCAGLAVGITDGLVIGNIKHAVGRPRPNEVLANVRIVDLQKARPRIKAIFQPAKVKMSKPMFGDIRGASFPSGHAGNNFALAVVIAIFYRRWGWLYFGIAALVSYSRIYNGSHYPLDTIGGAIIGAGIACLVLAACEALWRRFAPRFVPALASRHPSLLDP
jgi:undecaprenyl-diphosphatase